MGLRGRTFNNAFFCTRYDSDIGEVSLRVVHRRAEKRDEKAFRLRQTQKGERMGRAGGKIRPETRELREVLGQCSIVSCLNGSTGNY